MDSTPNFDTPEEEINYWKKAAIDYIKQRDEAREELHEFTSSSKELELELETELQQSEKKLAEYRSNCNRLQLELDTERKKTLDFYTSAST
ncbi:unnamed protein product [Notodromas monacha]|uniref:Uncharacterized protein n=1 Tax=Notodromas monacha TaxID=399045 RepID=A0A7R9G9P1_9CRUS|nr:unnamed protein product [Notodromas monacha]CAG0913103.1 unnamed protein product [Notodromas monacha]